MTYDSEPSQRLVALGVTDDRQTRRSEPEPQNGEERVNHDAGDAPFDDGGKNAKGRHACSQSEDGKHSQVSHACLSIGRMDETVRREREGVELPQALLPRWLCEWWRGGSLGQIIWEYASILVEGAGLFEGTSACSIQVAHGNDLRVVT